MVSQTIFSPNRSLISWEINSLDILGPFSDSITESKSMNVFLNPVFLLTIIRYCYSSHPSDYCKSIFFYLVKGILIIFGCFNEVNIFSVDTWRCYSCYPNYLTIEVNCPRSNAYRKSPSISCLQLRTKLIPWARCKTHLNVGKFTKSCS